jgi:Domain of unknown function (DUF4338)
MSGVTFSGRTFTTPEIDLMREIARDYAGLGVTEIARTVCELLHWNRPGGGLKNHECRLLLEHLRDAGRLALPAVRALGGRGPRKVRVTTGEAQAESITGPAGGFSSMQLQLVKAGDESRSWRQYMEQHHYLGCPVPYGAHLRYWVRHEGRVLACLLWTSPAWRMKARDVWIGWGEQQRQQNLQRFGEYDSLPVCPPVAPGLGGAIWLSAAVAGDACGCPAFRGYLLSRCQLDPRGPNGGPWTHGPACTQPATCEGHLLVSTPPPCPSAAMRIDPVIKYARFLEL